LLNSLKINWGVVIINRDKLKSWNDGPVKQSIIDFLNSSVEEGPNFIEPGDRIATFDNDGTLWAEKPTPVQLHFLFIAFAKTARKDPSLTDKQPYKAIIERDETFFQRVIEQKPEAVMALEDALARQWAGKTPEEFDMEVKEFFRTVKPEKFASKFTDLVYKPMLELFDLLKDYKYRVFVCSGGGRDFMRVISEETWGIFKENVIGSASEYEYNNGTLKRLDNVLGGIALGPGKVEHIFARTGRIPVFAGGNSDVDIEMLESARFKLFINHDDDVREFAYKNGAEKLFNIAKTKGYTIVNMKTDWNNIFRS
jgi:phosphoglycolate phosphatase-like HAD superfamily hydrolase